MSFENLKSGSLHRGRKMKSCLDSEACQGCARETHGVLLSTVCMSNWTHGDTLQKVQVNSWMCMHILYLVHMRDWTHMEDILWWIHTGSWICVGMLYIIHVSAHGCIVYSTRESLDTCGYLVYGPVSNFSNTGQLLRVWHGSDVFPYTSATVKRWKSAKFSWRLNSKLECCIYNFEVLYVNYTECNLFLKSTAASKRICGNICFSIWTFIDQKYANSMN